MARYLNTPEARALGEAVLDLTMPGAVAAAEDAQEDGFDTDGDKARLSDVRDVDATDAERRNRKIVLNVRDYQDDPVDIGTALQRALEALGWKLERL